MKPFKNIRKNLSDKSSKTDPTPTFVESPETFETGEGVHDMQFADMKKVVEIVSEKLRKGMIDEAALPVAIMCEQVCKEIDREYSKLDDVKGRWSELERDYRIAGKEAVSHARGERVSKITSSYERHQAGKIQDSAYDR